MPLFRITKKLATALHTKLRTEPVESPNPEHEWFGDLFYVERKKCVIWVHRTTLLTFVQPDVVATDLREFHALFRREFRTAIASMGLPESLIDRFGVYQPAAYAATNDRGIVGSMLDYRKMFALMVDLDDGLQHANVREINAQLNGTPMSVLKRQSPVRIVQAMLAEMSRLH